VQEALTNVRKHAAARRVTINVCVDDAKVRVEIADDGSGFDPGQLTGGDGQHFGQQIMRDRAAEIGGSIEVVSAPGQGTRLIIHAPLLREAIPA
jgi:signal transduction histidine kinase